MRIGAMLRLAAAVYPGGLERFEKYWDFTRGRPRQGSGDLLVAFVVSELAETHTAEASPRSSLLAAARRLEGAAKQLNLIAQNFRAHVPAGARVIRADFSPQKPKDGE